MKQLMGAFVVVLFFGMVCYAHGAEFRIGSTTIQYMPPNGFVEAVKEHHSVLLENQQQTMGQDYFLYGTYLSEEADKGFRQGSGALLDRYFMLYSPKNLGERIVSATEFADMNRYVLQQYYSQKGVAELTKDVNATFHAMRSGKVQLGTTVPVAVRQDDPQKMSLLMLQSFSAQGANGQPIVYVQLSMLTHFLVGGKLVILSHYSLANKDKDIWAFAKDAERVQQEMQLRVIDDKDH